MYLLCEKGYRPNTDVNEEDEAFIDGRTKTIEAEENIEENDGMNEDNPENAEQGELRSSDEKNEEKDEQIKQV